MNSSRLGQKDGIPGLHLLLSTLNTEEEVHTPRNVTASRTWEGPSAISQPENRISVLQPEGSTQFLPTTQVSKETGSLLVSPESSIANELILVRWDSYQASGLQNCKKINLPCFNSLHLWKFVMTAIGNYFKWLGQENTGSFH